MKKIKGWFRRNKHTTVLILFSLLLIFVTVYTPMRNVGKKEIPYEYKEKFELHKVPAGMIIWKHGVPNTNKEFIYADSATRYEYYDIGILTKDAKNIYCVRVPYYTIGMFQLGSFINIKNKNDNQRNLRPKYYVQPYNIEKSNKF